MNVIKSDIKLGISISPLNSNVIDGIGHYTQQLISHFETHPIQCNGFEFNTHSRNPHVDIDSLLSSRHTFANTYPRYMLKSFIPFEKQFRFDPKVDIFHCTDYHLIPLKCPTVTTLYDAIPLIRPEWSRGGLRRYFANYFIKRSADLASHVITISEHAARDIMQFYKVKEKDISVTLLGVDDKWFAPVDQNLFAEVKAKYNLPDQYYLSVGTLQPRKNIDRLIDAYLSLPLSLQKEKKLVIVGKYGWGSDELVKKIKALVEQDKMIWLSNVHSDDDLRYIYLGANVFVFPSLYEGFGLPVAEAFASGVPVVCSNTTSLPEVSKGAALEVDPCSVGDIAKAMEWLATNTAAREEKIKQGYLRASELRWQDTASKTYEIYKQVLGR